MSEEKAAPLPSVACLQHAFNIAQEQDRPIMTDYWGPSRESPSRVLIGVRDNGEQLLVLSEDEYTSPVQQMFKVENDYIVLTENSLYVISADVETRKIS